MTKIPNHASGRTTVSEGVYFFKLSQREYRPAQLHDHDTASAMAAADRPGNSDGQLRGIRYRNPDPTYHDIIEPYKPILKFRVR